MASGLQSETDYVAAWDAIVDFKRRQYSSLQKEDQQKETVGEELRAILKRYSDYFTQCLLSTFIWRRYVSNICYRFPRKLPQCEDNTIECRHRGTNKIDQSTY